MRVLHTASGKYKEARITLLRKVELTGATKKRFDFDWEREVEIETYKITFINDDYILGLMSVQINSSERRCEIRLLELSRENRGDFKVYDRLAGCLIAFACKLSFKEGFNGFVSLIPKTVLISHYMRKYFFSPMGAQLYVRR
ncbi:hypothetical protein QFZ51_005462 [Chitinophaga sp. W3I9]|uniref:hypothetical protein n=1 Tax=Chitinophaga sp. W3I9 TaxID=3373924 RepID=UPI003D240C35